MKAMDDQLYRRSMGFRYDPEALEREIASGYAVRARTEPTEDDPPTASDLIVMEIDGSENDLRLQDIEFELAQGITPAERAVLEAEKVVRLEQRRLDQLAEEHPRSANALQDWLMNEMQRLVVADVPIDDEMLAEAEILDEIIAEVRAETDDDEPLIRIAEVMRNLIAARKALETVRAQAAQPVAVV